MASRIDIAAEYERHGINLRRKYAGIGRRLGLAAEDVAAECDLGFLMACVSYRKSCGPLDRWAAMQTYNRLRRTARAERRAARRIRDLKDRLLAEPPQSRFDLIGFTRGLSADAQTAVRVVLERAVDGMRVHALSPRGVWWRLLRAAGLSRRRIERAATEIREALA